MGATAVYISARSEILCAAAILLALIFARRAVVTSGTAPAALTVGFGAVAAVSSPASAALPFVMLAYDRWVIRSKGWERRLWRLHLPVIAVVALASGWRLHAALTIVRVPAQSFVENLLTESIVIWRYAALLVVPVGQAIVHDVRRVVSPADPLALLALVAIVAAVAGAVRLRRKAPLAAVALIWFFAAVAPTSSLIPLRDPMAETRLYVAAAGLIFAVLAGLARVVADRRIARTAVAAALAVFAFTASTRTRVWRDPLTLWTEAALRAPGSWQAHFQLARALGEAGQCDRAKQEYLAAVRLNATLPPESPLSCSQR
jgi:hypothetical protein